MSLNYCDFWFVTVLFVFSVFVLLYVVFDFISSLFDCSKLSLTSSKFKCLSLELSATKSVGWKARFCNVLSLNVRGLHKTIKRRQIFRWLHQQKPDVVFLQETYSSAQNLKSWEAEWGGKRIGSHGTNHSRGVMILFKPKLDVNIE